MSDIKGRFSKKIEKFNTISQILTAMSVFIVRFSLGENSNLEPPLYWTLVPLPISREEIANMAFQVLFKLVSNLS